MLLWLGVCVMIIIAPQRTGAERWKKRESSPAASADVQAWSLCGASYALA